MKCGNCGLEYDGNAYSCPCCNEPLYDAGFRPVRKRKRIILWLFLLLLVIGIGGALLFQCYMQQVTQGCRDQVGQLFKLAEEMDFVKMDKKARPKELMTSGVAGMLLSELSTCGDSFGPDAEVAVDHALEIVRDSLIKDVMKRASYQIIATDTKADRCTVSVRTENLDFGLIVSEMKSGFTDILKKDRNNWEEEQKKLKESYEIAIKEQERKDRFIGWDWWYGFQDTLEGWFGSKEEPQGTAAMDPAEMGYDPDAKWIPDRNLLSKKVLSLYDSALKKTEDGDKKVRCEGEITFARKKTYWILENTNQFLFYSFYGISIQN